MSIREQAEAIIADPLLSPADCAAELGCTAKFICAEIRRNKLKCIKVNEKIVRVRRSWWNAYLAQRETRGVAA